MNIMAFILYANTFEKCVNLMNRGLVNDAVSAAAVTCIRMMRYVHSLL